MSFNRHFISFPVPSFEHPQPSAINTGNDRIEFACTEALLIERLDQVTIIIANAEEISPIYLPVIDFVEAVLQNPKEERSIILKKIR